MNAIWHLQRCCPCAPQHCRHRFKRICDKFLNLKELSLSSATMLLMCAAAQPPPLQMRLGCFRSFNGCKPASTMTLLMCAAAQPPPLQMHLGKVSELQGMQFGICGDVAHERSSTAATASDEIARSFWASMHTSWHLLRCSP